VLVTFLCLAAIPDISAAQDRAGLTLGATASDVAGDFVTVSGDTKWGFYGGVFGETQVGDVLALSLGVNYTQKGGRGLTGSGLLEAESFDLSLNYIELPFLVELMLPLGGTWDLMAYSGIAAAFNVTCNASLGGSSSQSCGDTSLGGGKTEWGLPVGGGLFYTLGNGEMVVFEARYTWGLNDAVSNANVRNRTWQFLIRLVKGA
jgi:hypothetical protein